MATDRSGRRRRQKRAKLRRWLRDRVSIWDVVWGRTVFLAIPGVRARLLRMKLK